MALLYKCKAFKDNDDGNPRLHNVMLPNFKNWADPKGLRSFRQPNSGKPVYIWQSTGNYNLRVIVEERVFSDISQTPIYVLRDYVPSSEFEKSWRHTIKPALESGIWLDKHPLTMEEIVLIREELASQTQSIEQKKIKEPFPRQEYEAVFEGITAFKDYNMSDSSEWQTFYDSHIKNNDKFCAVLPSIVQEIFDNRNDPKDTPFKSDNNRMLGVYSLQKTGVSVLYQICPGTGNINLLDGCTTEAENKNTLKLKEGKYFYIRSYLFTSGLAWNMVQNSPEESNLALSSEQRQLIGEVVYPSFINAQAGTGKSVVLHCLAVDYSYKLDDRSNKILYISENKGLLDSAAYNFENIITYNPALKGTGLDKYPKPVYKTLEELMLERLAGLDMEAGGFFQKEKKKLSFDTFKKTVYEQGFRDHSFKKKYDAEEVWFAVNAFIKGIYKDRYLKPEDLDGLNNSLKESLDPERFEEIYHKYWTKFHLKEVEPNYWTRVDLARYLLCNHAGLQGDYIALLCDEVQDYTLVEIELLMRLTIYTRYDLSGQDKIAVNFAGDPLQTINPSGFDSTAFRQLLYAELSGAGFKMPDAEKFMQNVLRTNFRSVKPVVDLANAIQYIRSIRLGKELMYDEQKGVRDFRAKPVLFPLEAGAELKQAAKKNLGKATYIAFNETDTIPTDLLGEKASVVSLTDIKGLEEDTVVVYGFGEAFLKLGFDAGAAAFELGKTGDMALKFTFNKLYVAVTRAKRQLVIMDPQNAIDNFWLKLTNPKGEKGLFENDTKGAAIHKLVDQNPNITRQEAYGLFKNARGSQNAKWMEIAAKKYEGLGDTAEKYECAGYAAEYQGDWKKAAELFWVLHKNNTAKPLLALSQKHYKEFDKKGISTLEKAKECAWVAGAWDLVQQIGQDDASLGKRRLKIANFMLGQTKSSDLLEDFDLEKNNVFEDVQKYKPVCDYLAYPSLDGEIAWKKGFYKKFEDEVLKEISSPNLEKGLLSKLIKTLSSVADSDNAFNEMFSENILKTLAEACYRNEEFKNAIAYWDKTSVADSDYFPENYYRALLETNPAATDKMGYLYILSKLYANKPQTAKTVFADLINTFEQHKNTLESDENAKKYVFEAYLATEGKSIEVFNLYQPNAMPWQSLFNRLLEGEKEKFFWEKNAGILDILLSYGYQASENRLFVYVYDLFSKDENLRSLFDSNYRYDNALGKRSKPVKAVETVFKDETKSRLLVAALKLIASSSEKIGNPHTLNGLIKKTGNENFNAYDNLANHFIDYYVSVDQNHPLRKQIGLLESACLLEKTTQRFLNIAEYYGTFLLKDNGNLLTDGEKGAVSQRWQKVQMKRANTGKNPKPYSPKEYNKIAHFVGKNAKQLSIEEIERLPDYPIFKREKTEYSPQNDVLQVSKKVFEHLLQKNSLDPGFVFRMRDNDRNDMLTKGFPFLGAETNKIFISFWEGNDEKEAAPMAAFVITENGEHYAQISFTDKPEDSPLISLFDPIMPESFAQQQNAGKKIMKWRRDFDGTDYLAGMETFIKELKTTLDKQCHAIIRISKTTSIDGFSPVTPDTFKANLNRWEAIHAPENKAVFAPQETSKLSLVPQLSWLHLENIGHFTDVKIGLSARVTCIIGENGLGKSTLLRAIALGLCGVDGNSYISPNKKRLENWLKIKKMGSDGKSYEKKGTVSLRYEIGGKTCTNTIEFEDLGNQNIAVVDTRLDQGFEITETQDRFKCLIVGFPQNRSKAAKERERKPADKKPNITDVLPLIMDLPDGRLGSFSGWIVDLYKTLAQKREENRLTNAQNILDSVFEVISLILSENKDRKTMRFKTVNFATNDVIVITPDAPNGIALSLLSQGLTSVLTWVGCFMQRIYESESPDEGYKETDHRTVPAILLIDEIDTYLHPKWQRSIIEVMVQEFKEVRFVITTHSPLVLGNVRKEDLAVWRVSSHQDAGIIIEEEHEYNPYGAKSDSVMFRLMNLPKRTETVMEKLEKLFELIDAGHLSEAKTMKTQMEALLDPTDEDIMRADAKISFKERRAK